MLFFCVLVFLDLMGNFTNEYLLSIYFVSGIVLMDGNTTVNETDKNLYPNIP